MVRQVSNQQKNADFKLLLFVFYAILAAGMLAVFLDQMNAWSRIKALETNQEQLSK